VDFYVTCAQVIPLLLLALVFDSEYLTRLKDRNEEKVGLRAKTTTKDQVRVWTKARIRNWSFFVCSAAIVGEVVMLLVLADVLLCPSAPAKAAGLVGVGGLVISLAVRVHGNIVHATK
jgi:hypothetical protein